MNEPRIKSSTKGASITKQGHTTSGAFWSNIRAKNRFGKTVTELNPKG